MPEYTEYDDVENALDEADDLAEQNTERLTHEEVFSALRKLLNKQQQVLPCHPERSENESGTESKDDRQRC